MFEQDLTLDAAIQAVANCIDADEAVVTILQNIALGDSYQEITSGVFTIDLNGFEISNTEFAYGALYIKGAATKVTVQGTGENSKITGDYAGIDLDNNAALTITGGKISGGFYGVSANGCSNVTITNGTISGDFHGVSANNSTVKVVGGAISGTVAGVFASNNGAVIISGGSIYGDEYDIHNYDSTITLTVGEDGVGATFPGGIELEDTTLDAILGEGAGYWQGNTMIIPADDATTITGGDVTIKAVAQQVSPSINQKGRTLSYEDLIYVIDIFDLAGIEGIDLTKDAGLLIWSVEEFEDLAEIAFDADHAKVGLKPYKTTGYYSGSSDGIFTRDLHKDAYYVGYVKLADGSYIYSEPKLYSPAIYAHTMLGKDTTSAETKELCVALLNYISAAQVYFHGTVEEDLVNYELTDEQKALNWENISFNLAPEIPDDKQVAMDESVFQRTGKNLLFEEMISIVPIFVVNDDIVANAQESGTIFWTAEQFAALEGAPSIDNIGAGTKVEFSRYRGNVNQWCSYAPEVAAKDMADTQYFYLGYVIHADGSVSYSGVISYTVEQYISNKVNDPDTSDTMLAFAQWLYRYERAAEAALKN